MSKSDAFENDFLKMLYNRVSTSQLVTANGDDFLWLALHSATPGDAGNQTTNENGYGGYFRLPVKRSPVGFTVTGNVVNPAYNFDWFLCTGLADDEWATHFSVGAGRIQSAAFAPASLDVTVVGHNFQAGQPIYFQTTEALPPELATDTVYYVLGTGLATDTFHVAATPNGAAITPSTAGTGTHSVVSGDGPAKIYHYGTLTPNIHITYGVTPRLTTASTVTEE